MMIVLGIDIGVSGAIALVNPIAEGSLFIDAVHDMPVLRDGPAGRRAINAPLLASLIYESHADHAYVEHVGPRPGEGAVGAFAFGRARGVIEGVLAAAGVPCTFITPPAWKRIIGLPAGRDKDASRGEAIRRWPSRAELFARIKDDGRAEACLIAVAGIMWGKSK
jgi:crossover junction endodeoxyribonuclease RuvC